MSHSEKPGRIELSRAWSKDTIDVENRNRHEERMTAIGTLYLAFKTLGVIYGDIGTSPLYVFTGIFGDSEPTDPRDVYGAVSLIIWTLTIIPLIKYVLIVLKADDDGEGGTFALYGLLARHCGIPIHAETRRDDLTIINYDAVSTHSSKNEQNFISRSKIMKRMLFGLAIAGAALIMADGVLTPAISVISAVEGLQVEAPSLESAIVPISCAIIIALCMVQRFGTGKVGITFAPIVALWLFSLFSIGIWNTTFHPEIYKVYNPWYSIDFFRRKPRFAFNALGGVFLAVTGSEALFADLGHFNLASIRIGFTFFTYPSLVLAYLGQAARLVDKPSLISNTFWLTIPSGAIYWIVYVLAILATIIASQAMITATFTLTHQAMRLNCFPNIKIIHTSTKHRFQIYIPEVNYVLMVAVVLVCIGFKHSANLTHAYGVAVVTVMIITTCLVAIVMSIVWRLHLLFPILFFLFFGFVDVLFFASTVQKIQDGAWFTLAVAPVIMCIMGIWKWGTVLRVAYEIENKRRLGNLFTGNQHETETSDIDTDNGHTPTAETITELHSSTEKSTPAVVQATAREGQDKGTTIRTGNARGRQLRMLESGFKVPRLPGIGLFYQDAGLGVPFTFSHFMKHLPAAPEMLVFISVRTVAIPHVGEEDRLVVKRVADYDGVYRVIARYGYMERVCQSDEFITRLVQMIRQVDSTPHDSATERIGGGLSSETRDGDPASSKPVVTYVLGRHSIRPNPRNNVFKNVVLKIYDFMLNSSRKVFSNWEIPVEDIVEVGVVFPL